MSETASAATGRCFGIQRVCQVWERSRSALYARRARAHHRRGAVPARRGPPPRQSDAQLLAAIRTDLARSPVPRRRPSQGPRTASDPDGIRVARTRVLRVMRARTALPAPRASGRREDPRREGHHSGAQRDVGDGRRAGIPRSTTGGAGSSRQSNTGTRVRGGGTCAKSEAASRHSIDLLGDFRAS